MHIVFASDTHLSPARPRQIEQFNALLSQIMAWRAELYLLGDLVEFWLGDDDDTPLHRALADQLAQLVRAGCRVWLTHGNRDFLMGERFHADTGVELLEDYTVREFGAERVLLTHGDLLCTRDVKYQAFRRYVRDPANQRQFLSTSLAERRRIAAQTREGTQNSMLEKDDDIMDVEEDAVINVMREFNATTLIHGHTHRPAHHVHNVDGHRCERWVLNDWYERGGTLRADATGCSPVSL